MEVDLADRATTGATKGGGASANPFTAPVDEQPLHAAVARKPLSIWLAQMVLALFAAICAFDIWQFAQRVPMPWDTIGRTSLALVFCVATVVGVQARRRWARIVLNLLLVTVLASSIAIRFLDTELSRLLFAATGGHPDDPIGPYFLGLSPWAFFTIWVSLGERSRAYFAVTTER